MDNMEIKESPSAYRTSHAHNLFNEFADAYKDGLSGMYGNDRQAQIYEEEGVGKAIETIRESLQKHDRIGAYTKDIADYLGEQTTAYFKAMNALSKFEDEYINALRLLYGEDLQEEDPIPTEDREAIEAIRESLLSYIDDEGTRISNSKNI